PRLEQNLAEPIGNSGGHYGLRCNLRLNESARVPTGRPNGKGGGRRFCRRSRLTQKHPQGRNDATGRSLHTYDPHHSLLKTREWCKIGSSGFLGSSPKSGLEYGRGSPPCRLWWRRGQQFSATRDRDGYTNADTSFHGWLLPQRSQGVGARTIAGMVPLPQPAQRLGKCRCLFQPG